jgi:hypothetical protein
MGLIKDAKVNKISAEASRAIQEGRSVFLCRINVGMTDSGMSGTVGGGAAEIIESVESLGWRLDQMSYTTDRKGAPEGYYLFRRAQQAAYPPQAQQQYAQPQQYGPAQGQYYGGGR